MAVYEQGSAPIGGAARAGVFMQYAGAAVSLALIAGIGVWGYKLVMRDVTGIPVVRAMDGDMRVLPDTPGGAVTSHTGLSVNAVAAEGQAAAPQESVALAPATRGLSDDDVGMQDAPQTVVSSDVDAAIVTAPIKVSMATSSNDAEALSTNDILALADQIAAGSVPLAPLTAETLPVAEPVALTFPNAQLRTSKRPVMRSIQSVARQPSAQPALDAAVTTTSFAVGTHLVQLGAYPSAEVAAKEWVRLQGSFGELLSGKTRVIQVATTGGREFYRLRAHGFNDGVDARRLCAALVAERADCIPVIVR